MRSFTITSVLFMGPIPLLIRGCADAFSSCPEETPFLPCHLVLHDHLELVAQVQDLLGPECVRAPPRVAAGEVVVVRLPGPPGEEIDDAHEAQRLDEG